MQIKLKRLTLKFDLLMLFLPLIALALGLGDEIFLFAFSLGIHEAAHVLAARAMRVGLSSIRFMPFGGAAKLENPYAISPLQLLTVSAAGPLANLLLILIVAAFAHWRWLEPLHALNAIRINAMLMLFNLLPALPLDGGRMLYALLRPVLGQDRALQTGIFLGRALAGGLAALTIWYFVRYRLVNLSFLFAAIFLVCSVGDERRALADTRAQSLLNSLKPIRNPVPVEVFAINSQSTLQSALRAAHPDRATMFAVYQNGRFVHFTDDRTLLNHLLESPPSTTIEQAFQPSSMKQSS